MISVVAGVDTSTQSCKVELFAIADGRRVSGATAPHPPVAPPRSEQDPRAWWSAFVSAFRAALAEAGPVRVQAISVAGQCHGMVPLDANGDVIRDAKLWNDTTTDAELRSLTARIGAEQLITATGSLPTAAFTLSKVAWFAAHEPENFARLATILLPHDYLTYRLTGAFATDRSEASGTGYFDPATNVYLLDHLALIDDSRDWASLLPEVLAPEGVAGSTTAEAMVELGITEPALVSAGGGDQHASALGLGIAEGDAVFAFGTSGVVFSTTPDPVRDPSGLVNGVANLTGGFLPLVCTLNGAKVVDTFARLMGTNHDELSELALAAGQEGPVLAAFLDGERTPNRPLAAGLLADLTTETTREQLARAAYEGVVFGLVAGLSHVERCGVRTDGEVIAIGGAARSSATRQILADALGKPVHLVDAPEAVARGAAVQAASVVTGAPIAELAESWKPERRVSAEPRRGSSERFARYSEVAAVESLDRSRA
ncbi:xylulokinase [Leucobacter japonicus]|uniref:xylulokinase n=1 Tax=Leucobacter japonicus TaxID=1461259 RepID=UPI0006A7C0D3|nr:xylulokinase [Leucobacter japonicus]